MEMIFISYIMFFCSTLSRLVIWIIRIAMTRYKVDPIGIDQKLDTYHPLIKNSFLLFGCTFIKYRFSEVNRYPTWWYALALLFWLPFDILSAQVLCYSSDEGIFCLLAVVTSVLLIALAGKILIDTLVVSENHHD